MNSCKTNGAGPGAKSTATTFLFGPKFTYRACCRITPFGQVLVGGIHGAPTFSGLAAPANAFALAAGGGFDVRPFRSCLFALRVAEAEYLLTHFNGAIQNNFQFKTGIVFR